MRRRKVAARTETAASICKAAFTGSRTKDRTANASTSRPGQPKRTKPCGSCASCTGARDNNLPVVPNAERLTCKDALGAVVEDFRINGKKSIGVVERRITKHLLPYLRARRMAGVTTAQIRSYIAHRVEQGVRNRKGDRVKGVSNAQVNRELQILKRAFNLARKDGRLGLCPYVPMLKESAARVGFFEPEQFARGKASARGTSARGAVCIHHRGGECNRRFSPWSGVEVDSRAAK